MRFRNRNEVARHLAEQLSSYRGRNPLVLGIPRGGVPMARIIADALGGELDVVLVRKLRAPGHLDLAIGAVDEAGMVWKGKYHDLGSDEYLREEIRIEQEILPQLTELYMAAQDSTTCAQSLDASWRP